MIRKVRPVRRATARSPRRVGRALALAAGAAVLVACGGGSSARSGDQGSSDGGLDEVTFLNVLPMESLTFSPEMVADACGHFKRQGLDVTFETTNGSAQAIQSIIAGSAQITRVGDIETVLAAGDKGAAVTNIGTALHRGPIRIVSSSRAPIDDAQDFRGTLVGLPSEGGTSEMTLDLVLGSAGIAPEQVDRQVVGLTPGVFNLVKSGRIGSYIVSFDTSVALQQQEPDAVVFDPAEAIRSGAQVYMTSQQQLEDPETRDQLERYLAGIRSAMEFIAEDEANGFKKTMECISSSFDVTTLAEPDVARSSLSGYVDSWLANGRDGVLTTNPEQWQATYDEMVTAGLVDSGMTPQDWYTNELAPGSE